MPYEGLLFSQVGGRDADTFYRDRWSYDKVVRSTHGVNCTGSCSWKVYVKDGIITWESQQTDYPSVGPDRPEYEPRGCPRGAAFSWYTYSPTRVRFPYARGLLVDMYREAKNRLGDPVAAWADIQAGLSASADEISWVQTAYLIAEVVMIPLSGTLSRMMSTRTLGSVVSASLNLSKESTDSSFARTDWNELPRR